MVVRNRMAQFCASPLQKLAHLWWVNIGSKMRQPPDDGGLEDDVSLK